MPREVEEYSAPTISGPDRDTRTPRLTLPSGACDCHAHVFGPQSKFRYAAKRSYTPPDASPGDYLKMLNTLGVERGVLVQPSIYGTDNAAMCEALASAKGSLRGIAVVDEAVTDNELGRMHQLGVRGLRLRAADAFALKIAARIALLGWHIQFRVSNENFGEVEPLLKKLPVDIVVDHIGQVPLKEGVAGPNFQAILRMAGTGRCWVKLSAPMRMSEQEFPYSDVTPFVRSLVKEAPERMVWGTDWPHPQIKKKMPNDADLVDLLSDWIPDAATRNRILAQNPARLYGF